MAKTDNIISINGQSYDADTGVPVVGGQQTLGKNHQEPRSIPVTSGDTAEPAAAVPNPDPIRPDPLPLVPHPPTMARTLMRNAVRPPSETNEAHQAYRAQGAIEPPQPQIEGLPETPAAINTERLARSQTIDKSDAIKHFVYSDANPEPTTPAATASYQAPAQPTPQTFGNPNLPPVGQHNAAPSTTTDLLERALQHADTHEAPASPKRKHRSMRSKLAIPSGIAVIALALVFGGRLVTNSRLHDASAAVGFSASLPAYHLSGYSLGTLNYGSGEVVATFHSNSDSGDYYFTQTKAKLSQSVLVSSFVAANDPHYQTVQSDGLTIYIYNQHNATWINNGIWYVIKGNQDITANQLIKLADSL